MASQLLIVLRREVRLLARSYLGFSARPAGDYTRRQLSAGAAYTVFCHAEFESFFEGWAQELTDLALTRWRHGAVTRPLVHLCSFHGGRAELSAAPKSDVWSELVMRAIKRQQDLITHNNGIKEANVCRLLAPLGFDVRKIDPLLLADLNTFAGLRGAHAHQTHSVQLASVIDPFDRQQKAEALLQLVASVDADLEAYRLSA